MGTLRSHLPFAQAPSHADASLYPRVCVYTLILYVIAPADAHIAGAACTRLPRHFSSPCSPALLASPRLAAPGRSAVFAMSAAAAVSTRCPDPSPHG